MLLKNLLYLLFFKANVSFSLWEFGICNQRPARRHKKNRNVQFILWRVGDQKYVDGVGHTEDKWVNFDSSWWDGFVPTN
jgi:hypothetical protein